MAEGRGLMAGKAFIVGRLKGHIGHDSGFPEVISYMSIQHRTRSGPATYVTFAVVEIHVSGIGRQAACAGGQIHEYIGGEVPNIFVPAGIAVEHTVGVGKKNGAYDRAKRGR